MKHPAYSLPSDASLFCQGGVQTYESRVVSKDGIHHEVIFHKATLTDSAGLPLGIIGALQDVTDSRKLQGTIAVREQEYLSLAESSPSSIIRYDRKCRIRYLNTTLFDASDC